MALTLMYITNKPDVAKIAQKSGGNSADGAYVRKN